MSIYKGEKLISGSASTAADAAAYPKPDWAVAVTITEAQFREGFAAPSDGMFVGICGAPTAGGSNLVTVNNVEIALTSRVTNNNSNYYNDASISIVVAKGDIIKCSATDALFRTAVSFVPWK